MIKRIVKLTFREAGVETFLAEVFEPTKARIRAFPGCRRLELLRDLASPNVLFTFSCWEEEAALEAYRQSEFFQQTWAATKALFAEKAQAWTVAVIDGPEQETLS